ncbi:MAG: sigma-54-dependent transcriptional regulator [bacterium]
MKKILVVDDDPLIGLSLKEALKRWDYEVTLINEGSRVIDALQGQGYDMVFTDMRMPNVTGMDVLEKVQQLCPSTGVIMITAYGSIAQAVEAMQKGAFDFITKPYSLQKIKACLDKYFCIAKNPDSGQVSRETRLPVKTQERFVGENVRVKELFRTLEMAYHSDAPVFIQGESGTGKELIAEAIHCQSARKEKPYLRINCAALPENLVESQLFGHEKGAFTGAIKTFKGLFEEADGGTLLLDEITEMPLNLQAKFLRVLQEGEFSRVGSTRTRRTDVRIVATTNSDVQEAIAQGRFRQDLYYRLAVLFLRVPPLRERKDDIPLLCEYFLKKYGEKYSNKVKGIDQEAIRFLSQHAWPGNVRELENIIQRSVLSCRNGEEIGLQHVQELLTVDAAAGGERLGCNEDLSLEEMEKRLIAATLQRYRFHKTRTAEILGVTLKTLRNKILQYGLETVPVKTTT